MADNKKLVINKHEDTRAEAELLFTNPNAYAVIGGVPEALDKGEVIVVNDPLNPGLLIKDNGGKPGSMKGDRKIHFIPASIKATAETTTLASDQKAHTDVQVANGNTFEFSFQIPQGIQGIQGETPVMTVVQEQDGLLYWYVDGKKVIDSNGQAVRAVGIVMKGGIQQAEHKTSGYRSCNHVGDCFISTQYDKEIEGFPEMGHLYYLKTVTAVTSPGDPQPVANFTDCGELMGKRGVTPQFRIVYGERYDPSVKPEQATENDIRDYWWQVSYDDDSVLYEQRTWKDLNAPAVGPKGKKGDTPIALLGNGDAQTRNDVYYWYADNAYQKDSDGNPLIAQGPVYVPKLETTNPDPNNAQLNWDIERAPLNPKPIIYSGNTDTSVSIKGVSGSTKDTILVTHDNVARISTGDTKTITIPAKGKEGQVVDDRFSHILAIDKIESNAQGHITKVVTNNFSVPLDECYTNEKIKIIGGPLADQCIGNETFKNNEIPINTDIRKILKDLLCKELWPSDKYKENGKAIPNLAVSHGTYTGTMSTPNIGFTYNPATQNGLALVGTQVSVTVSNGSMSYETTDPMAYNFRFGYSATDDNVPDSKNTSFTVGHKESITKNVSTLKINGAVPEVSKEGTKEPASPTITSTFTVAPGVNTVNAYSTGVTSQTVFDELPSYWGCSNIGNTHSSEEKNGVRNARIPSETITVSGKTSSSSESITGVYPVFDNIVGGVITKSTTHQLSLSNTSTFYIPKTPTEVNSNHFAFSYPDKYRVVSFKVKDLSGNYQPYTATYEKDVVDGEKTIAGKKVQYLKLITTNAPQGDGNEYEIKLNKKVSE